MRVRDNTPGGRVEEEETGGIAGPRRHFGVETGANRLIVVIAGLTASVEGSMEGFRLTARQRRQLRAQMQDSKDTRTFRRAVALMRLDQGRSVADVAAMLGVTRQTLYNWVARFQEEDDSGAGLQERSGRGRPSVWTERARRFLSWSMEETPKSFRYEDAEWTIPLLQRHLGDWLNVRVSDTTLREELHRLGYAWKEARFALERPSERRGKQATGEESRPRRPADSSKGQGGTVQSPQPEPVLEPYWLKCIREQEDTKGGPERHMGRDRPSARTERVRHCLSWSIDETPRSLGYPDAEWTIPLLQTHIEDWLGVRVSTTKLHEELQRLVAARNEGRLVLERTADLDWSDERRGERPAGTASHPPQLEPSTQEPGEKFGSPMSDPVTME